MPLITCPTCGHRISVEADACPECGHPNRLMKSVGPTCYACSAPATTRCQKCGALSCALHLQNIYVYHGEGGANELRCQSCYASAEGWRVIRWVIVVIFLFIVLIIFLSVGHH